MQQINLEEGDLVLCTVDRIVGTVVFVRIEGLPENTEGSITMSEIAPGRIRNIRDYVVPRKKIVCRILRIVKGGNIELSLRRVSQKETKEVLKMYSLERSYESILRNNLGDKYGKYLEQIKEKAGLFNFMENAKKDSAEIEKILGKENAKKILDILNSQKSRNTISKKEITLTSSSPNGLELIKNALTEIKNSEIRYITAGRYSVQCEDTDPKTSGNKLKNALNEIEEKAKKNKIEFSIKQK